MKSKLPVLETERLIMRPLTVQDAEEIFTNWTGDPEVAKFMRWDVHQNSGETRTWIEAEQLAIEEGLVYDWGGVLKETGELVGSGGLCFTEEYELFELGYNIMRKYWGMGLATEAARCIVKYSVQNLGIKKLYCCHAKDNPASGRVMEKAGFVYWRDGSYLSRDGKKEFQCREYLFECE